MIIRARLVFWDYLRAFIIILVVLHHAVQAYTTYAQYHPQNYVFSSWLIVDPRRSYAFDLFQRFQDMYFMSLLFLISGLFTWPSLIKKGAASFSKDRLLRLGLPFLIGITLFSPIAEYACYRVTRHTDGFLLFWTSVFFQNYWYVGPFWFLWVLLFFSFMTAATFKLNPAAFPTLSQRLEQLSHRPILFSFNLLILTFAAYALPFWLLPDAESWSFQTAPFWAQTGRLPLYMLYYFFGVAVGVPGLRNSRIFQRESPIIRAWPFWTALSVSAYLLNIWGATYGSTRAHFYFSAMCTFHSLALIGLFCRFFHRPFRLADLFSENTLEIYVVHFPIVVWLQFWLLEKPFSPFLKAGIVAVLGIILSFVAAEVWSRVYARIKSRTKASPAS
jgi:glucan biosynthesis protein C